MRKRIYCTQLIPLPSHYCLGWNTAQKVKLFIKDFCSKCDQFRSFLRIWSHLLEKSLMENFIFCAVYVQQWGPALMKFFRFNAVVKLKNMLHMKKNENINCCILCCYMFSFCLEKNEATLNNLKRMM